MVSLDVVMRGRRDVTRPGLAEHGVTTQAGLDTDGMSPHGEIPGNASREHGRQR